MPSLSSRILTLAVAIRNHAKMDIKHFFLCPILLEFCILFGLVGLGCIVVLCIALLFIDFFSLSKVINIFCEVNKCTCLNLPFPGT